MEVACQRCSTTFEAQRRSAKWCSDRCRKRKPVGQQAKPAGKSKREDGLVAETRRELEAVGRLHSALGQLALELARAVMLSEVGKRAALSKEFERILERAKDGAELPKPPSSSEPAAKSADLVDQIREKRDAKARAAARPA